MSGRVVPDGPKLLLVAGPESSATRLFLECLSRHPQVLGHTGAARDHADALDDVWARLGAGDREGARRALRAFADRPVLATRRSYPHGPRPGEPARYLEFVDLEGFAALARSVGRELVVLVPVRSPAAHLASWTARRASTAGDFERAARQYQEAYRAIFRAIDRAGCPFLLLPYEALLSDGEIFLRGVFALLGLDDAPVALEIRRDRNRLAYERALPAVGAR